MLLYIKILFETYIVVFNFVQTSTKKLLQLTLVKKCRFSATSHVIFLTGVTAFLSHFSSFGETSFL